MSTIRINSQQNLIIELAIAVLGASSGDTIVVNSEIQKKLGEHSIVMYCPGKDVKIVVEPERENEQRV